MREPPAGLLAQAQAMVRVWLFCSARSEREAVNWFLTSPETEMDQESFSPGTMACAAGEEQTAVTAVPKRLNTVSAGVRTSWLKENSPWTLGTSATGLDSATKISTPMLLA